MCVPGLAGGRWERLHVLQACAGEAGGKPGDCFGKVGSVLLAEGADGGEGDELDEILDVCIGFEVGLAQSGFQLRAIGQIIHI